MAVGDGGICPVAQQETAHLHPVHCTSIHIFTLYIYTYNVNVLYSLPNEETLHTIPQTDVMWYVVECVTAYCRFGCWGTE